MVENALPDEPTRPTLRRTPLDALHRSLGARMVPFAGYDMPVQYKPGILAEHLHCRAHAALFDVSHMGQVLLEGPGAAAFLETLVPGDMTGLKPGRQRYTLLLNEAGGIVDDLMVARLGNGRFLLVVNASRKDDDFRHIAAALPERGLRLAALEDRALIALQGPEAARALAALDPAAGSAGAERSVVAGAGEPVVYPDPGAEAATVAPEPAAHAALACADPSRLSFMGVGWTRLLGVDCVVSRSGYTGEDGFEISVPAEAAATLAGRLLREPGVQPAGLGARDSLRLEAGLPLWGNDIDELTSPVEAGLTFALGKRRRMAWDFPGAAVIRDQLENGPHRRLVGILPDGRAPARAGTLIAAAADGTGAGTVTSGGFGPSVGGPIAIGYVRKDLTEDGTELLLAVRGNNLPARVVPLPFVPHRYVR